MFKKVPRRVLTGQEGGKSVIVSDVPVANSVEHLPGLVISDVWATDTMPADLSRTVVTKNTLFPEILPHGTYLRYVHIPPDSHFDQDMLLDRFGVQSHHPLMHQTDTLDYIVILSGEITLLLEAGKTRVQAGDIVIQRATNHAWSNQSNTVCIMLAVLVDAKL